VSNNTKALEHTERITGTPEFQRAYEIHGQHYEGLPVTPQDQEFYIKYLTDLAQELRKLSETGEAPFSLTVWIMYAVKYT